MPVTTIEKTPLPEKGVRIIQVDFADETGNPVTPNADTVKWTLTDKPVHGDVAAVINGREQVAIASAPTIYIVLEGDDLALLAAEVKHERLSRVLTIEYQYDSSIGGNNLDDAAQYIFEIENMYYKT